MKTQIKYCPKCMRSTVQNKTECLWCRKKREKDMDKLEKRNPVELARWKIFCDLFYRPGAKEQGLSLRSEASRISRRIGGCPSKITETLMDIARRWSDDKS